MPERVAARENREVLHHDRISQRAHDLVGRDARLDEIDDVGFCEDAALGRNVVQVLVVEMKIESLFGRHADLDHALVDCGARARSAFVVHRGDGRLVASSLVLFEDDDLRVLTAELDDRARVGVEGFHRQGDGVHLLNELRAERFFEWLGARAGDEHPHIITAELREDGSDAYHEVEDALRLLGVMTLVITPDDLFGLGINDDGFDRRGPHIQSYCRSLHQNGYALPS